MTGDGADRSTFERYRDRVERPLWRILRSFGKGRRQWLALGILLSLVEQVAALVPPFILGVAIDAVFVQSEPFSLPLVPAAVIPGTRAGELFFSTALIGVAFAVASLSKSARGLCLDFFSHRLMHEVRTETYEKIQRLDMPFFDEQETGELMSVLNNDVSNFETFFDDAFRQTVRVVATTIGVVGLLVYLNWQLALVTMVAVPLIGVATIAFVRRAEPAYDAIRASVGNLNTRLEHNLGGIELIKSATTEEYEADRVEDASWQYFTTNWWRIKLELLYHPGTQLITNLSFVATFFVGGVWLVLGPPLFFSGSLSVGTLVTFLFMSQRFTGPLKQISGIVDHYENARASGKRVFGLLDMPVRVTEADDAVDPDDVEGRVTYDDVSFAYGSEEGGDEESVVEDVSFEADPGQTVGLVGPTGAGKSTLMKLLMRLYDVDEGAISVDGHDVRNMTLDSLRGSIGYVSQEAYLFGGTVRENIAYGQFDVDQSDVEEAAKAAEAHEFITNLPEGYDTMVGERGVKLSGGQRQRVALARVVLQDPEVLVLDEATSNVDTETELLIQKSLDRLTEDRTTFVIAHRLSTVRDADTIIVLRDGQVVERGDHGELLEEDGLYANLWAVQAGDLDSLPDEFIERASAREAEL